MNDPNLAQVQSCNCNKSSNKDILLKKGLKVFFYQTERIFGIFSFVYLYISRLLRIFSRLLLSSCYRTVPSTIWEIFPEFSYFATYLQQNIRNEENIFQYCTMQRAITTLSLNACRNKMYQKLSYC